MLLRKVQEIRKGPDVTVDMPEEPKTGGPLGPAAQLRAEIERLKLKLIEAEWKIAELEARADVDPLLEILNRRGFERELTRSLAYVRRYATAAVLVFIDLDGFKAVNDRHGHAAGDVLLKAVAAQLASSVRASDVVARFGGDEFAVLLWNLGEEQAIDQGARSGESHRADQGRAWSGAAFGRRQRRYRAAFRSGDARRDHGRGG